MVGVKAKIRFDTKEENPKAVREDLSTAVSIRPAVSFGDGELFMCEIFAKDGVEWIKRGECYDVLIIMLLMHDEMYKSQSIPLMVRNNTLFIYKGHTIVGSGLISDVYSYITTPSQFEELRGSV
jgi:hypothetical protein